MLNAYEHKQWASGSENTSFPPSLLHKPTQALRYYRALSPRVRLIAGGAAMAYAAFGLLVADRAEQVFGFTPTEQDKKDLQDAIPRVHTVERERK